MDIAVNFRLGYFDQNGHEVMNPSKVAKRYMGSWFAIDFMSSLPYDLFADSLSGLSGLRAAKFFKMYRLIRLAKLSKLMKSKALLEALEDWVIAHRQNLRVAKMFLLTFILTHFNACAWAFVGRLSKNCNKKGWYCSYGDMGDDSEDYYLWMAESKPSRYLTAMYFSMTTISTVGYGDIKPVTDAERFLAIFSMIVGGSFYGYVVANMSSLVSATDSNSKAYFEKMDQVTSYMQVRRFPMELAYRVRKHFKHTMNEKTALDERQILQELSTKLRREVCLYLVNDIVYTVDLFDQLNPETFANVVINLKPMQCAPGDNIFHKGDYGHEMYIVVSGKMICRLGKKAGDTTKDKVLKPGDYFGELSAFDLQSKRTCSIDALVFSELYTLSREDLYAQFHRQPHVMDKMRTAALEHARKSYVDLYGSKKKKFRNLVKMGAALKDGKSLAGFALAAKGKLDIAKEKSRDLGEEKDIQDNKPEKKGLSLFGGTKSPDASAREKLQKQSAEGHEKKLLIIENLQKTEGRQEGSIPSKCVEEDMPQDDGDDAPKQPTPKIHLCDSRKQSLKALYETQGVWFRCIHQDMKNFCTMMVSLKNDALNEVLLRGCISLASSIANTTRLCNETMDTFMNLTDIGQLSEDEQKKVLADLENSVAAPVEKLLGMAAANEATELASLFKEQNQSDGTNLDFETLQDVLDDWLLALPIKEKQKLWKACVTSARDTVMSENSTIIENHSIPAEVKELHLASIKAKSKALDALVDPSSVDPGKLHTNKLCIFKSNNSNKFLNFFLFARDNKSRSIPTRS